MLPKIRLKPTPYEANTSACTASDVVYGESPNQTDGSTARIAAVTTIGRSAQPIPQRRRSRLPSASEQPAWPDEDRQGGGAEEDDRRDVLPDVVGAQRVDDPRSTPARNAPATLPRPPTTATISAKVVSSKPALTVTGPLIEYVIATIPGQRAAQREDDRADERRVDADEPRADLVLDHRADAAPEGRQRRRTEGAPPPPRARSPRPRCSPRPSARR